MASRSDEAGGADGGMEDVVDAGPVGDVGALNKRPGSNEGNGPRQRWMAVLARASRHELEAAWTGLSAAPRCDILRAPERGLMMVRGRAGGDGKPFNLGEVSVARCAVRSEAGHIGHGYVLGGDGASAELVARFDALLQDPTRQAETLKRIVEPMASAQSKARERRARKAAATKVEFFTMVRGS